MPQIHKTVRLRTAAATLGLGFALLAAACPVSVQAQSTSTYRTSASFGGINYQYVNSPTGVLNGYNEYAGAFLNTSGESSYSFGDGAGEAFGTSDTIRISGTGAASSVGFGFTDLKARVAANLENGYLDLRNIEDAPTNDNGMNAPFVWIANVSAGWTLTSRFNSSTNIGSYNVKWIFGVDGSENTNNGGYSFAYLGFSYGTSQASFSTTSLVPQLWATDPMPVVWATGVETNADFNTNWQYNLIQEGEQVLGEEGDLIGYRAPGTVGGIVDYSGTVKLQEIQVFDANGNRFYDFTVDDGSGNVFYRGSSAETAAPEPGTLALLALGAALGIPALRRRQI